MEAQRIFLKIALPVTTPRVASMRRAGQDLRPRRRPAALHQPELREHYLDRELAGAAGDVPGHFTKRDVEERLGLEAERHFSELWD